MSFGQIVIGPPGAGKTTYCTGIHQLMEGMGRKPAIINLDPANEWPAYAAACTIDVADLVDLCEVTADLKLGPNGGLVYCMEYLLLNIDWLLEKLEAVKDRYLLFDMPGQVELYTHDDTVRNIVTSIEKWGCRLCCVNLIDSHYITDPSKFIPVLLVSLSTMLRLELPHVNVLSKIDLVEKFGKMAFSLDFYAEVLDLKYLIDYLKEDATISPRFARLNQAMVELIEDFSLVSFRCLTIEDKQSVANLLKIIDKANGYIFGTHNEIGNHAAVFGTMAGETDWAYNQHQIYQDRYGRCDTDSSDLEENNDDF